MERVAFLLEETGERISCLLNPESLVLRRRAGLQPRHSISGALANGHMADTPLLYTGSGTTELDLDLLFDVSLAGSTRSTQDVRQLTGPLWRLAENTTQRGVAPTAPGVRFVWGKSWNLPGVIAAVAERLEHFAPSGAPRRSWLRMRFIRVDEAPVQVRNESFAFETAEVLLSETRDLLERLTLGAAAAVNRVLTYEIHGGGSGVHERPDQIAFRFYANPAHWRILALFNGLDDPLHIEAGFTLRIPLLD